MEIKDDISNCRPRKRARTDNEGDATSTTTTMIVVPSSVSEQKTFKPERRVMNDFGNQLWLAHGNRRLFLKTWRLWTKHASQQFWDRLAVKRDLIPAPLCKAGIRITSPSQLLPTSLMQCIFRFLPFEEYYARLERVCKWWRHVSLDAGTWLNVVGPPERMVHPGATALFLHRVREARRLELRFDNEEMVYLGKKHTPWIRQSCERLTELAIHVPRNCALQYCLANLVSRSKLQKLTIQWGSRQIFETDNGRFWPVDHQSNIISFADRTQIATFTCLTELNLGQILSSLAMGVLAPLTKLRKLWFVGWAGNAKMEDWTAFQELAHIRISCLNIVSLRPYLWTKLPMLSTLEIGLTHEVTSRFVKEVGELHALRTLRIASNDCISPVDLARIFASGSLLDVKVAAPLFTRNEVFELLELQTDEDTKNERNQTLLSSQHQQHLELYIQTRERIYTLSYLADWLPTVQVLTIPRYFLDAPWSKFQKLKKLTITLPRHYSESDDEVDEEEDQAPLGTRLDSRLWSSLLGCTSLEYLCLEHMATLANSNDMALSAMLAMLPNFRRLIFSECEGVGTDTMLLAWKLTRAQRKCKRPCDRIRVTLDECDHPIADYSFQV